MAQEIPPTIGKPEVMKRGFFPCEVCMIVAVEVARTLDRLGNRVNRLIEKCYINDSDTWCVHGPIPWITKSSTARSPPSIDDQLIVKIPHLLNMTLRLTLCCIVLASSYSADAETAGERVFRKVGPTIVELSVLGGWGSGILVSEDGLVLTNRHVADAPLILGVKCSTPNVNTTDVKPTTFNKVELIATHPTLDLALLKVEAPGVRFRFIDLKSRPVVTTGMECFAIGMPSAQPSLDELNASITRGIVSAARVVLPHGAFIQTDAPINPGNSGGALCSAKGEVIGLVTAKRIDAEGIAYAIPLSEIKLDEFENAAVSASPAVPLDKEIEHIEDDLLIAYQALGKDRTDRIRKALDSYQTLIKQHGPLPRLLFRFGELHISLGDPPSATACFELILKQEPSHPGARWLLGALAWEDSKRNQALSYWLPVVESGPQGWATNRLAVARCLSGAGQAFFQQGRNPAAAYCFHWARQISPDPDSLPLFPKDFDKLLTNAISEVPSLANLRAKNITFSAETFASLRNRTPGRNRDDRYASAIGESDWLSPPAKTEAPRLFATLTLPAGATRIRIKSPRPGMTLDQATSQVSWEDPPTERAEQRVLVLYKLDGQTHYAFAIFPPTEKTPDSRLNVVPHE